MGENISRDDKEKLLVFETPVVLQKFIIDNNLISQDNLTTLRIIIDKLIEYGLQRMFNINMPSHSQNEYEAYLYSLLEELDLEPESYKEDFTLLFSTVGDELLSKIVAYDLVKTWIYCRCVDLHKIVIEYKLTPDWK